MANVFSKTAGLYCLCVAGVAHAENVEIFLTDMLDNTQAGYCLDIARDQGWAANPADGLQGHTCYSPQGRLGVDQTFEATQFADGLLHMPKFDVCAQVGAPAAGAKLDLEACDGSPEQTFVFSGEGTITPASAPDLCLTLAEATRSGRSDANQIKALTLEPCSDEAAAYQTWGARVGLE